MQNVNEAQIDEATASGDELERCDYACRILTPTTIDDCPECGKTVRPCANCNHCRECGSVTTDLQADDHHGSWCGYACGEKTANYPQDCANCEDETDWCEQCDACKRCGKDVKPA
ncbi:hypothetical protein ABZ897_15775 [Nonomuraea sp. NPDC046802]|uniref:hypothetical protein n=1 Tax=Nonomuraea sp. NPDC046802 TaxID=3154919 RepID=UPI0033F4ADF1